MGEPLRSVIELISIIEKYNFQFGKSHRSNDFIFRGMSNESWPLLPGIFRKYSKMQTSKLQNLTYSEQIYESNNENEILWHFKKEAAGFLPSISQENDYIWLQYAQHFGAPTRLLDFTSSPLTALYFCCKSESEEDGSIWLINTTAFHHWSCTDAFPESLGSDFTRGDLIATIINGIKDKNCMGINRPIMFVPAFVDQRMSAQASKFLLWGKNEKPLEDMIDKSNKMEFSPDGVKYLNADDQRFLSKIIISGEYKHCILRELDVLGINEKSLFPGLDGIGRYIEKHYKVNADDRDFFDF
jgi:hypothetical protein